MKDTETEDKAQIKKFEKIEAKLHDNIDKAALKSSAGILNIQIFPELKFLKKQVD